MIGCSKDDRDEFVRASIKHGINRNAYIAEVNRDIKSTVDYARAITSLHTLTQTDKDDLLEIIEELELKWARSGAHYYALLDVLHEKFPDVLEELNSKQLYIEFVKKVSSIEFAMLPYSFEF